MAYISMKIDGIFDMSYNEVVELHDEQFKYYDKNSISPDFDLCKNNGYVYLVATHDDGRICDPILGTFPNKTLAKKCCDEYKEMCPDDDIYCPKPFPVYYSKKHYYDCKRARKYIHEFDLDFTDYDFSDTKGCTKCDMYNFFQDESDSTEYVNILNRNPDKKIYTLEMTFLPRRKMFVLRGRNENDFSTYPEIEITYCPFCNVNLQNRIKKALKEKK